MRPQFKSAVQGDHRLAELARTWPKAKDLWNAAVGNCQPEAGSLEEAFIDTMPAKYAPLLGRGGPALTSAVVFAGNVRWKDPSEPFQLRERCREGWQRFIEKAEERESLQFGLGFCESESWDHDFCAELPRHLLPAKVYDIARLAGRLVAMLRGERAKKVSSVPEEVYDVELGGDPSRLLTSELMHLGQPTELMLLNRINEQRALQYKLRGEAPAGRGPLVIAIDESGSMGGENFKRGVWAKAVAVALTSLAWEDDRPVVWVHWSTASSNTTMLRPDKGKLDLAIRHFYGGGNQCAKGLYRAADNLRLLSEAGYPGGDVVLITDGVEQWTEEHESAIDVIQKHGARLWTIGIEVDCEIEESAPIRARAAAYTAVGRRGLEEADVGGVKGAVL